MVDLLGWGELVLVLGLALVIVGPRDLPKVFYALGKGFRLLKGVLDRFQEEWDGMMRMEQLKELEKEMKGSSSSEGSKSASQGGRRSNKNNSGRTRESVAKD